MFIFFLNEFFIYITLSFIIVIILFIINFFFSSKNSMILKNSIYECGFESFSSFKENFDLRYFVIGIIFLIFDIEIIFLFPISINFFFFNFFGFWVMLFFIFILLIGFIYEWKKGSLNLF